MAESALLIEVPEAEPVVSRWRLAHDPVAARGVPAHITILFPFEGDIAAIPALAARHEPFEYELTHVDSFPGVVWLAPEPAPRFVALTEDAMAAFPKTRPYNGVHAEIVPHVTVAMTAAADVRRALEDDVVPHLPLRAQATHLALYTSDDKGTWRRDGRFPLGNGVSA